MGNRYLCWLSSVTCIEDVGANEYLMKNIISTKEVDIVKGKKIMTAAMERLDACHDYNLSRAMLKRDRQLWASQEASKVRVV